MFAKSILIAGALASVASAHMEINSPYPLHSKWNPATPEAIRDYSMTTPLATDGTQYPCKGYINNPSSGMDSVTTWNAGETVPVTAVGTATHGGGSCQFMMSYDQGANWNVIHSIIGGCMVDTLNFQVPIPSNAPSGEAIFGWSWFNHLGNREMYQNCAVVTVANGGSGLTGPTPFVANAGNNDCHTLEGFDVVFPNPGDSVQYGGSYASSKPTAAAGFTGSNCVAPGASNIGNNNVATPSSTTASSASAAATSVTSDAAATTASVSASASASPSASASTTPPKACKRSNKKRSRSARRDLKNL